MLGVMLEKVSASVGAIGVAEAHDDSVAYERVEHAATVHALHEAARRQVVGITERPAGGTGRLFHGLAATSRAVTVLPVEGLELTLIGLELVGVPFNRSPGYFRVHLDEVGGDALGHGVTVGETE